MKLALALLTKDHLELTERSIEPLLQPDKFDLWWIDGSINDGEARRYFAEFKNCAAHRSAFGGPDAAIVYALTEMLKSDYTHVGIIEQDVLLHPDWFAPAIALFERGKSEGLEVGAVSARCYEDRILIQRDGYALCHNLGAGMSIFTRQAAELVLTNYRSTWAPDNRLIFSQLAGIDIGRYWAFRGVEQFLTADWGFDAILARHGLASLALTPSLATMLDQDIAAQGLKMADGKFDLLRNAEAFDKFKRQTLAIRRSDWLLGISGRLMFNNNAFTIFPHQVEGIGGSYSDNWTLRWQQGFGPFVWKAGDDFSALGEVCTLHVPVLGPCDVLISGSPQGGQVEIADEQSGYGISPELYPDPRQMLSLVIPGGASYRTIRITALAPGVSFHGLRTVHPQPWYPGYRFDHSRLPRVK